MEVITSGRLNARVGFASYNATFAICFFFRLPTPFRIQQLKCKESQQIFHFA